MWSGIVCWNAQDLLELAHCLLWIEVARGTMDENYLLGGLLGFALLEELDAMG